MDTNKKIGIVKKFNGHYGFIESDGKNIFFHKSDIVNSTMINNGDFVEFNVEPSKIKNGLFQASEVSVTPKPEIEKMTFSHIGRIEWFNLRKGFGIINTPEGDKCFLHLSNYRGDTVLLKEGNVFVFEKKIESNKIISFNCQFADEKILSVYFEKYKSYLQNYPEFHFLLWLDGFTHEKDMNYIAQKIALIIINYANPFVKIFEKIPDVAEQQIIIDLFLSIIGKLDTDEKFSRIKKLVEVDKLDKNIKSEFIKSIFESADKEIQYNMWFEGLTKEKDLYYISQKFALDEIHSNKNTLINIIGKISEPVEQQIVLNYFISILDKLDTEAKYDRTKLIVEIKSINENIKIDFINSAFNCADEERRYLMWLDGFIHEKDLNYIAQKFALMKINYSNPFEKIFEKINDVTEQQTIINLFLSIIGKLDTDEKYVKIKTLAGVDTFHENIKTEFIKSVFYNADQERQYMMWFDGLYEEKDLDYIAQRLLLIGIHRNPFVRISEPLEQQFILKKLLLFIEKIDTDDKYNCVRLLKSTHELNEDIKNDFLKQAFDNADKERQYLMLFFDYIVEKKDIHKRKCELAGVNEDNDNNFNSDILLKFAFSKAPVTIKPKMVLKFLYFNKEIYNDLILSELFEQLDVCLLFDFFYKLIDPLAKTNTHYYHNGLSYLKIYLTQKYYIQQTNNQYGRNSIFFHDNILLTERHFEIKLNTFKMIFSYIAEHNEKLEQNTKEYINSKDDETIISLLKNIRTFYAALFQICEDLKLEMPLQFYINIKEFILETCHITTLLKLWVYDFIDHFDYNSYCCYYFTLTLEERKIFNKKAKAQMGNEIKTSMLKKKIPWTYVGDIIVDDVLLKKYTATWKSIWFCNHSIKLCIGEATFSRPFLWDFSEDKFNFLYEYISGKRLKELTIFTTVEGYIKSIDGLEELEEIIFKALLIKEVETSRTEHNFKDIGQNKIPVNMINRNKCIQLLNKLQIPDLAPKRIIEKTINIKTGTISVDFSFLFSIPLNNDEICIIWESLELEKSKATHIFKCTKSEYESIFSEIEFFLSNNTKVRSALNSKEIEDVYNQKKIRYLCRIDHDNFDFYKWENSLYCIFPELNTRQNELIFSDE